MLLVVCGDITAIKFDLTKAKKKKKKIDIKKQLCCIPLYYVQFTIWPSYDKINETAYRKVPKFSDAKRISVIYLKFKQVAQRATIAHLSASKYF